MQTDRRTRRIARRGLFEVRVGLTIAFATALASALPFIQGERFAFLAGVPVVALNPVLLAAAFGWLIWHVFIAAPEDAAGRARSAAAKKNAAQRPRLRAASAALYHQLPDGLATSG